MAFVTHDSVAHLPEPVRRSIETCGVMGTAIPNTVTVRQSGRIRSAPNAGWQKFTAVEDYTPEPPGFVWRSTLRMGGLPMGKATDSLTDGKGHMQVRLLGMVTVVDEHGPEIDQGSALRWLNETMFFPAVWTTPSFRWEAIDDHSAAASVTIGSGELRGEFRFNEEGHLVDFVADRYRGAGDDAQMTRWTTPLQGHRRFGELLLPSQGSAVWHLNEGEFEYIQITVEDVQYN